jgi:hypothetical protein
MDSMYNQLTVGIYYYTDEDGKKVFDVEEMRAEFEMKLEEILKTENNGI